MPAPVVSPASASPRGKESTHFTITNGETARWSRAASPNAALYTDATLTTLYNGTDYRSDIYLVAANEKDTWNLVATNASSQATNVPIVVTAIVPPYWDFKTPVTLKKRVRVFDPKSGPRQTRTDQGAKETWEFGNADDSIEHFEEIEALWDYHYPDKTLLVVDVVMDDRELTIYIDSDLKREPTTTGGMSWSFVGKEA